jgi:rubredoxin
MQENHKYTLEKYSGMKSRYDCPNCLDKKVFTKYIDTITNEYLSDGVGRCERINNCGFHYKPKQFFEDNNISFDTKVFHKFKPTFKPKPETSFINLEVMQKSKASKQPNFFIDFLASLWDYEIAYYLADKYNIGTSKLWNGATVFFQVDESNKLRTGKIMLYDPSNGKRVKEPYNYINWVHKALRLENFNLEQCLFGQHLLHEDKNKPIAIVESEKTAIIASVYLPEFIWLACGSATNLNKAKTKVLKGRNVVLFPDLKCYDLWRDKIPHLTKLATFRTSTLLEERATASDKKDGLDLADFLINIKPQ